MSKNLDLSQLREVAGQATPGPWETLGGQGPFGTHAVCHRMEQGTLVELAYRDAHFDKTNAVHIATFDPPTVLALIARLEAAEQAVARVREVCESDGYEVSNEFGTWDAVVVENIIDALDGEQS